MRGLHDAAMIQPSAMNQKKQQQSVQTEYVPVLNRALRCFPEGCFNNLLWSGLAFCLFSAKEANTFTRLHWAFKRFFVLDPIHFIVQFQMCFAKITNENKTRWHPQQDRWQKRVTFTSTSARPSD